MDLTPRDARIMDRFRVVAAAEAISLLALFGVAMPLKYGAGLPEPVTLVGWVHGILFLWYVWALISAARVAGWSVVTVIAGLAASVVPFGPFVFHRWVERRA